MDDGHENNGNENNPNGEGNIKEDKTTKKKESSENSQDEENVQQGENVYAQKSISSDWEQSDTQISPLGSNKPSTSSQISFKKENSNEYSLKKKRVGFQSDASESKPSTGKENERNLLTKTSSDLAYYANTDAARGQPKTAEISNDSRVMVDDVSVGILRTESISSNCSGLLEKLRLRTLLKAKRFDFRRICKKCFPSKDGSSNMEDRERGGFDNFTANKELILRILNVMAYFKRTIDVFVEMAENFLGNGKIPRECIRDEVDHTFYNFITKFVKAIKTKFPEWVVDLDESYLEMMQFLCKVENKKDVRNIFLNLSKYQKDLLKQFSSDISENLPKVIEDVCLNPDACDSNCVKECDLLTSEVPTSSKITRNIEDMVSLDIIHLSYRLRYEILERVRSLRDWKDKEEILYSANFTVN